MKYYILFGPPGAGKGTHAVAIAAKYNLKHISTGELLRAQIAAGTPLGMQAKALIADGRLVPDEVVEGMIEHAFCTITGYEGFLLDGFPRTLAQAEALDAILAKRGEKVNGVISIMIPDSLVYERIAGRAKVEGRADDASPEIISHRIQTYQSQTEPLKDYYRATGNYYEVDGYPGTIEQNRDRILAMIETIV